MNDYALKRAIAVGVQVHGERVSSEAGAQETRAEAVLAGLATARRSRLRPVPCARKRDSMRGQNTSDLERFRDPPDTPLLSVPPHATQRIARDSRPGAGAAHEFWTLRTVGNGRRSNHCCTERHPRDPSAGRMNTHSLRRPSRGRRRDDISLELLTWLD